MPDGAILFDGVWKRFRRGERHDTLRDVIPALVGRALRRSRDTELQDEEFWALRDVSFEVKAGEALGIIGPNGAGKSTALKLLTRVLRPTLGHCEIRGRAGALIDLSAGFRLDLTGRENIFLRGAILGLTRAETAARFDDIVSFAGLADFVDTPVKRYSTGMSARLGFAVAAQLSPDVLIVDEVLGVGDAEFRQRCHDRMTALKRDGVAIVVVSHNMGAIRALCDRTLLLREGAVDFMGPTDEAVRRYAPVSPVKPAQPRRPTDGTNGLPVVGTLEVVEMSAPQGRSMLDLRPGDALTVRLRADGHEIPPDAVLVTHVRPRASQHVAIARRQRLGVTPGHRRDPDGWELYLVVTLNLLRGRYAITFSVLAPSRQTRLRSPAIAVRVKAGLRPTGLPYVRTTAAIEPSSLNYTEK